MLVYYYIILLYFICSCKSKNINNSNSKNVTKLKRLNRKEYNVDRLSMREYEDRLETEIDPRIPRSFTDYLYEYQWTRQDFFQYIYYNDKNGNENSEYVSFQRWAWNYWYETRIPNSICPQEPKGIAAACDWAILIPCLYGDVTKEPKTVFVHTDFLHHLVESTFRFINPEWRFVLVSAGSDESVPRGILDSRFLPQRGFNNRDGGSLFYYLVNHPSVIHWFIENRDIDHPKVSSLPTGMPPDVVLDKPSEVIPLSSRPLIFLNVDRIRTGSGQWFDRWNVSQMCKDNRFCTQPFNGKESENGVTHKDFVDHLISVPFLLCVHGGGEDPSPKAFEAILMGTIPIVKRGFISDAYERFPIAWVDDWPSFFYDDNLEDKLEKWIKDLGPFYESGSELRMKVEKMLTTEYWYSQIEKKYIEYHEMKNIEIMNKNNTSNTTTTKHYHLRKRKQQ